MVLSLLILIFKKNSNENHIPYISFIFYNKQNPAMFLLSMVDVIPILYIYIFFSGVFCFSFKIYLLILREWKGREKEATSM